MCIVLAGAPNTACAESELEMAVVNVFKRNKCDACHVPIEKRTKDPQTGKLMYPADRDFSYVLDLNKLRLSKYITLGDPERSTLYKLLVEEKMPEGAEFCFDDSCPYPPVKDGDKNIIKNWILSLQ
ncbi:MAG: hypothetical protein HOB79_09585 [Rhodospirillaceae bacterium]|jgi:hypothetical protein|nr:hypothetical protein [Rhodospirillaceae bacterium]